MPLVGFEPIITALQCFTGMKVFRALDRVATVAGFI
jgi:hypothetical protein